MDADGTINMLRQTKGFAVVWLVMMIPVILLFAMMAVDFGYMYMTKGQLQNAADAAALAGASQLDGTNSTTQTNARNAAQSFASKNLAAGIGVSLNLNTSNNPTGDIYVGHWNSTSKIVEPPGTGQSVDAVQIVAKRTTSIFFGKIFNFSAMSASAKAVALSGNNLFAAPLVLCSKAIESPIFMNSTSHKFYLAPSNVPATYPQGTAWSLFTDTPPQSASQLKSFIQNHTPTRNDLCATPCIQITNGTQDSTLKALEDVYQDKTWDLAHKTIGNNNKVTSWNVIMPILDRKCTADPAVCASETTPSGSCTGCPPSDQPDPMHIAGWASALITDITATGSGSNKGITAKITGFASCQGGNPFQQLGMRPQKLVQ